MAKFDGLGELLSGWVGGGIQMGEQVRRSEYQDALAKQWLDAAMARERERKDALKERENDRRDRRHERETDRILRLGEKESDRKYDLQKEKDQRDRESAAATSMIDNWVESQRWKSDADKARARALGLAAYNARRGPIGAMNDSQGLVKPVDPAVQLGRDQLADSRRAQAEARERAATERALAGVVENMAGTLRGYGVDPTPQALRGTLRANPTLKGKLTDQDIDAQIGKFAAGPGAGHGTASRHPRPLSLRRIAPTASSQRLPARTLTRAMMPSPRSSPSDSKKRTTNKCKTICWPA